MSKKKIGILVGSLRKDSFSKIIAKEMAKLFPENYEMVFLEIGQLPLYNQDYDDLNQVPQSYAPFREAVKVCDGYMFVTPEYNRSLPAALKNALDVASRPYGKNNWAGKTGLVVSISPGALSGFGANHHLRQSLVFLDVLTLQQPEAYLGNVTSFIENGQVTNQGTLDFMKTIVDHFVALTEKN